MKRSLNVLAVVLTLVSVFSASAALAQDAPLQADIRFRAFARDTVARNFRAVLQGGNATVRGQVQNVEGEKAYVILRFDYRGGSDVALDEIIDRIVVTVEGAGGTDFSLSTIDPNDIHLNPNGGPLFFSTTLYRPETGRAGTYIVRIRVFGNYE